MGMKKVTTREDHICGYCDKLIEKGSQALFHKRRIPTYKKVGRFDEVQDGIKYLKYWSCTETEKCLAPKSCKKGNHVWEREMELDHYVGPHKVGVPTGNTICIECGKIRND